MKRSRSFARALLPACLIAGALFTTPTAQATDLDELRRRAQDVADEVSGLEYDFARLAQRKEGLQVKIEAATRRIALLELEIGDINAAYQAALDRYVGRAVEAYKAGPGTRMEILLSARDLSDLFALSKANEHVADLDASALDELEAAKAEAEDAQADIDARKQELLADKARADLVSIEITNTLEERRDALARFETEIAALETEARRQAALAPNPSQALRDLLEGTGPSRGIPAGFVGTGVVIEGTASWYGPGFEGNPTATGAIFDSRLYTAASKELPLNSWLYVQHEEAGVVVLVNDRGPYVKDWILDLSRAAAESIGITGIGWVSAEILIRI